MSSSLRFNTLVFEISSSDYEVGEFDKARISHMEGTNSWFVQNMGENLRSVELRSKEAAVLLLERLISRLGKDDDDRKVAALLLQTDTQEVYETGIIDGSLRFSGVVSDHVPSSHLGKLVSLYLP